MLHSNLGHEPGWQQLALMFRLTQSAVQLVGMGTAAALHIKEMSLRYFEDKFASWIVGQGGWVSDILICFKYDIEVNTLLVGNKADQ